MVALLAALGCGTDPDDDDSALTLSTEAWDFGVTAIGGRSTMLRVTVTNTGPGSSGTLAVGVSGPSAPDFKVTKDECTGRQLAGGGSCLLEVELIPTLAGPREAVLTVSAPDGARATVSLSGSGSGTGSTLSLTPTLFSFDDAAIGSPGVTKTFVVRNTVAVASGPLTVAITGANAASFHITRDLCSTVSLTVTVSCSINVQFVPATGGEHVASLEVTHSAGPGRTARLSGVGGAATTLAVTPPGAYAFGQRTIGTISEPTTFTLANTGSGPTGRLSLSLTGPNAADFHFSVNGCYPSLPVGGSCTLDVRFAPVALGTRVASIRVSDVFGSTATIELSGDALPEPPPPTPLSLSPSGSFTFAPTLIGATASHTVTVTNPGPTSSGPLETSVQTCSSDYYYYDYYCFPSTTFLLSQDNCAGVDLAAGASCTVVIDFKPTDLGTHSAGFQAVGTSVGGLAVYGSGTGLHASSYSLTFANVPVGGTSAPQGIVITNAGTTTAGPITTEISGFVFEFSANTCSGVSLAAGASCTISVRFKPTAVGVWSGTVGLSATPGGTFHIPLEGMTF
jgi:hypothetical protein